MSRLREAVAALGCTAAEALALAVLVAGAVAALGLLWLGARPGPAPPPPPAEAPAAGIAVEAEPLVVHVAGAVGAPGLYELPGGARVADALEVAGGPLPEATLDALNLARPLNDGEQLHVPVAAAPGEAAAPAAAAGGALGAPSAVRPDGTLDLNRATVDELDELPGIGPVLADRIVSHRETVGPFTEVGELRDVPGIGEKTFQELAPLVAV
jgi:competence protein ComEA